MGYACPVCGDPQADAGHLANHLAFTAILGDDDHEAWLEEHAPSWGEMGEAELADEVVDHVEETEFPQVFEDTVGGLEESAPDSLAERSGMLFEDEGFGDDGVGDGDHDHGHRHEPERAGGLSAEMDPETAAIVEEAREMTREMLREEGKLDVEDGGREEESTEDDADEAADADGRDGGQADERRSSHADENA